MQINAISTLKSISIAPLQMEVKQAIINSAFDNITNLSSTNMIMFLQQLQIYVNNFLLKYESASLAFNQSFGVSSIQNSIAAGVKTATAYGRIRNAQGNVAIAENFIRVLEEGTYVLNYIRTLLTGSSINTNIYIKDKNGAVYLQDLSSMSYNLVLSTYGSSGNNFVSLAYDFSTDRLINELQLGIENSKQQELSITSSDIYRRMEEVKSLIYTRIYFDSKDAEIYEFFKQRLEGEEIHQLNSALTKTRYLRLRKQAGRGPNRTTATQFGDVRLTQDKLITTQQTQVNIMRQTMIQKRFKELQLALATNDMNTIKQTFLKIFTAKSSQISDGVERMINTQQQQLIKNLFKA